MKKLLENKYTIHVCLLFVLLLLFLLLRTPSQPFPDGSKIEILQVLQVTENSEIDITGAVDTERLAECLCLLTVKRIGTEDNGFLFAETTYVIHIMYRQKPYAIIVGSGTDGKMSRHKGFAQKIYGNPAWNILLQELSEE